MCHIILIFPIEKLKKMEVLVFDYPYVRDRILCLLPM